MKKKYQSELLQVIHEDMKSLHNLGIISDAEMRKFDQDCLVSTPKKSAIKVSPQPEEITPITA